MAHLLLAQCSRLCTSAMLMLLIFSPTSSFSRFSAGKCADMLAACVADSCFCRKVMTVQSCESIERSSESMRSDKQGHHKTWTPPAMER